MKIMQNFPLQAYEKTKIYWPVWFNSLKIRMITILPCCNNNFAPRAVFLLP